MKLVPELYCSNLEESLRFYLDVLGFRVRYARPEEGFAYLDRDGVELMLESLQVPGRKWLTGPLERPFGRGVNFQCDVVDVRLIYARVLRLRPDLVELELERATYACGGVDVDVDVSQDQFVVRDPDGYLFRLCEEV